MNNFNANTRNRSQSVTTNTRTPTLQRAITRNRRAISDPMPMVTLQKKRNSEKAALEKDEKYLNITRKSLVNVEKAINCHERNGWFCNKPEKLYPKDGFKREASVNGLKKYKEFLNSSIKTTSNSIEKRKKRINSYSLPRAPLYPVESGYQNHKRNNFLNPKNMQYNSSNPSGGKRRTRRVRRTRHH